MSQLTLHLLGSFQVLLNDEPVIGFHSDKARALLAYLAVERNRSHRRIHLARMLWPDWPDSTARTYLRHALNNLRTVLGDRKSSAPFLLTRQDTLQFSGSTRAQIDAVNLQTALDTSSSCVNERTTLDTFQQLEKRVNEYRGTFLDGFELDGCTRFEEWRLLTRERLHRQMLQALSVLAGRYERDGRYTDALTYAWRRIELEPWLEEAHFHLMRLLTLSGRRAEALHQYQVCVQTLADELNVEPSAETIQLYRSILDDGLPQQSHTIRSISVSASRPSLPPHNLPIPLTPLLGREQEIAEVSALLRRLDLRLLSLTGPGGVGKTRLSQAVAYSLQADFPDGIFFAPLTTVRHAHLVDSLIAESLHCPEGESQLRGVKTYLQGKRCLLVLDNFEHVLDAAPLVTDLLTHCHHLKILVTSREVLRVRGEHVYQVLPLALPKPNATPEVHLPSQFAAIELFVQRAQAVDTTFVLNRNNVEAVTAICMLLDGLPLAIELAAAHMNLLSPQALLAELYRDRGHPELHVLSVRWRDVLDRHRSIEDTIAWSYELLDPEEQAFFRALSIFVGGFTLNAAQNICAHLATEVLAGLGSLVDKNLVQRTKQPDGLSRFSILETIRAYGLEQLRKHDEYSGVARRHAQHYLALAEENTAKWFGPDQLSALTQLDLELGNLRLVMDWALEHQDVKIGLRLGWALMHFWLRHSGRKEGFERITAFLALMRQSMGTACVGDAIYGRALYCAGILGHPQSVESQSLIRQALVFAQQADDRRTLASILAQLGNWTAAQGDLEQADEYDEACLRISRELNWDWHVAMHTGGMAARKTTSGDLDEAQSMLENGLSMMRSQGDLWGTAWLLLWRGRVAYQQMDYATAYAHFEECLALRSQLGAQQDIATAYLHLAIVSTAQRKPDARTQLKRAIQQLAEVYAPSYIADGLDELAHLAALLDQPERALCMAGSADAFRRRFECTRPEAKRQAHERKLAPAWQRLASSAAQDAWIRGEAMSLQEALTYFLSE